jgi:hypothetical protein
VALCNPLSPSIGFDETELMGKLASDIYGRSKEGTNGVGYEIVPMPLSDIAQQGELHRISASEIMRTGIANFRHFWGSFDMHVI